MNLANILAMNVLTIRRTVFSASPLSPSLNFSITAYATAHVRAILSSQALNVLPVIHLFIAILALPQLRIALLA